MDNKALAKGIAKISLIVLILSLVGVFVFNYMTPGFANTHTSHANVTPIIVKGGLNYVFEANVWNDGGDPISEFRIYNNTDPDPFTNLICYPADGWNGPYYIPGTPADFCQYTAKTAADYIEAGENKTFKFSADAPTTDCWRTINLETRDPEQFYTPLPIQIAVDAQDPETTKEYGDPFKGVFEGGDPSCLDGCITECGGDHRCIEDCAYRECGAYYREWISSETLITLTAVDPGPHPSGVEKTWYLDVVVSDEFCWESAISCIPVCSSPYGDFYIDDIDVVSIQCGGDGCGYECVEEAQLWCEEFWDQDVNGGPYSSWEECVEYHVNEFCYYDCGEYQGLTEPYWHLYTDPFYKEEESCHIIQYFSVDELGNVEDMNWQCVFVDNTPPIGEKTVGEPNKTGDGFTWVTQNTPITLNCTDQGPHPVNQEKVCYKVSLDSDEGYVYITDEYCVEELQDGWCCEEDAPFEFYFKEDTMHDLEFYCVDHLGNAEEPHDVQYYKVDTEPPNTTKWYEGPYYTDGINEWIDTKTLIHLEVEDYEEPCAIGVDSTWYVITYWNGSAWVWKSPWTLYEGPFVIDQESWHRILYYSKDELGNKEDIKAQYVYVDKKPPITEKWYGEPNYTGYWEGIKVTWINFSTPVYLNGTDQSPHPSGVNETWYRIFWYNPELCIDNPDCEWEWYGYITEKWYQSYEECEEHNTIIDGPDGSIDLIEGPIVMCEPVLWYPKTDWTLYYSQHEPESGTGPFNIAQESLHKICYYSIDKVNKTEEKECQAVIVDNTPPVAHKDVGPSIPYEGEEFDYWVNKSTPISLDCEDQGDHPVDQEIVFWMFSTWDEVAEEWVPGEWHNSTALPVTIYFPEDSYHDLEYYCTDHLGNEGYHDTEYFIVESVPPNTTKTYIGPWYSDGTSEWIDGVTLVNLTTVDPEPHPSGVYKTYYMNTLLTGIDELACEYPELNCYPQHDYEDEGWQEYTEPFNKTESCHMIEYWSVDKLGNKEPIKAQCVYVDHTPPVTEKYYEGPLWPEGDGQEGVAHWISSETLITLTAVDPGSHPSGVKETWYRNTLVDDEYCWDYDDCQENATGSGDWVLYTEPFTKTEESCHMIEYYSVDNVEKTEEMKKQCVFVDNSTPEPNKTVGKPRTEWDGEDASFYDIADLCWNGEEDEIECWKVTLFTPITLDCIDPDPHPVDQEETCFKVEVDGDDVTEEYCEDVRGDYDKYEDGFCCGMDAPYEFRFNEETEHNLKYYCVDALENKGSEDEEKFKVEGTVFEIQINKKWNLISVPFVMLDDSIDEVFKDIENDIESVWTYDGEADIWYLYVPDVGGTLTEMIPGWGYWVKAKNDTTLVIGGSLFSPVVTPPSKDLVAGWNLIGYYGIDEGDEKGISQIPFEWFEVSEDDADDWDSDDDDYIEYSLPWDFIFNGKTITDITFSSNGNIELLESIDSTCVEDDYDYRYEIIDDCPDSDIIFASSDDLDSDDVEGQYYAVKAYEAGDLDSNGQTIPEDMVVIYWKTNTYEQDSEEGVENNFEVILYPDGRIQWNFNYMDFTEWSYDMYTGLYDGDLETQWDVGFHIDFQASYMYPLVSGSPTYCALFSLVDTVIGFPRWSSVWTYWEPYNPDQWIPLGNCDTMNPGVGYWLEIDVPDLYTPSTACPQELQETLC